MRRRTLLGTFGVATGVPVAGCLGGEGDVTDDPGTDTENETDGEPPDDECNGSTPDPSLEERELPEKPDPVTADNVVELVSEYEEAWMYNDMLTERTTRISVGCPAAIDVTTDDGFYLFSVCRGSESIREGECGESVGHLGPDPKFYFVSDDAFRRIARNSGDRGPAYGNGTGGHEVQGFRVANFDDTRHEVEIAVTDRDEDELVLERSYALASESAVSVSSVTAVTGTYDVDIDLESSTSSTYEWNVSDIQPAYGFNLYLARSGEIHVGTNTQPRL